MGKILPKLFIGSSSEAKNVVDAVVQILSDDAICVPWYNAPEFSSTGSFSTLSALCDASDLYDFAVFILSGDDALRCRNKRFSVPRDNVIFEMGLFLGNLGPERVLGVIQAGAKNMKIPSDLAGINAPRFTFEADNPHGNISSLTATLAGFRTIIRKNRFREFGHRLADGWTFDKDLRCVEVMLGANSINVAKRSIGSKRLAIAARLDSADHNFEDDPDVRFSTAKPVPEPVSDMIFRIPEAAFGSKVAADQKIQGRVILVQPNVSLADFKTLRDALQAGCRIVETISVKAPANA